MGQKGKSVKTVFKVMTRLICRLCIIGGICAAAFFAGREAYRFGYRIFASEPLEEAPGTDVLVNISEDMSDAELTALLKSKGLIEDELIFKIQLKLYTASDYGILPGTYTLNTSQTITEMINSMCGDIAAEETDTPHLFEEAE